MTRQQAHELLARMFARMLDDFRQNLPIAVGLKVQTETGEPVGDALVSLDGHRVMPIALLQMLDPHDKRLRITYGNAVAAVDMAELIARHGGDITPIDLADALLESGMLEAICKSLRGWP